MSPGHRVRDWTLLQNGDGAAGGPPLVTAGRGSIMLTAADVEA